MKPEIQYAGQMASNWCLVVRVEYQFKLVG